MRLSGQKHALSCHSIHSSLRYTAEQGSLKSPQGSPLMSLKAVEELATQVPADDFQALEDKVYRTIEMYKAAREGKAAAERDVQRLRQQLEEREEEAEQLRRELVQLKKDREEVRARVEKMLHHIEAL